MAGDGRDLVRGTSDLSQPSSCIVAQPMGTTATQAGSPALIPEPVSKPGCRERLAELSDQECEVVGPTDFGRQRFMHRDPDRPPRLLLADRDPTIDYVLAAHADHIRAPLAGVQ